MNAVLVIVTIVTCYSGKDMKFKDSDPLQTKYIHLEQPEEWSQAQIFPRFWFLIHVGALKHQDVDD
ncbi:hypothetical protein E1301_Tti020952 [Triplophysa tibetana]|uniref:Uncharacterized protein n=1 Tax=Triplophysa tibetana TaxID=1572043 RepID=A0A5A9NSD3_9TELE|nr:hypothetical protein E1301_Tti020952 [Triplophysa tibetana]